MYCSKCGIPNNQNARFCNGCGQAITATRYMNQNNQQPLHSQQMRIPPKNRLLPGLTPIRVIMVVYVLILFNLMYTEGVGESLFYGIWLYLAIVPTFLPTYLGNKRSNNWLVFWVNLLTAWTIIGWFIALYLSVADPKRKK